MLITPGSLNNPIRTMLEVTHLAQDTYAVHKPSYEADKS